jgi:hypothetical protein
MNIQAILADKWVRIGGCILAVVFAITFLPAIFGWMPNGGLVFFNILLALVLFNVVVQRHPIMSLRWLYGIDLGLGVLLMLAALPDFSESAMAGIIVLVLIPLNLWTGFQFIKEMTRKASLQGKFLPAHEDGLTLEFTHDGNLILSNGKVYRYATRHNDLLLYDGDMLATKWEIAKSDSKALVVRDDQGKLHEYKKDYSAITSATSTLSSGLNTAWKAVKYSQENARLQAKWTAQGGSSPSIEFTGDGAFVRSDGRAGKYTVDWNSKTISVTLTDKTQFVCEIVSLSPTQLVLSHDGVATTYTTSMGKRLGVSSKKSDPVSQTQEEVTEEYVTTWDVPKSKEFPAFQIVIEAKTLIFEPWTFNPQELKLESIVTWEPSLLRKLDRAMFLGLPTLITGKDRVSQTDFVVYFYDKNGVELGDYLLSGSSEYVKGRKYKVSLSVYGKEKLAKVVIRDRDHKRK